MPIELHTFAIANPRLRQKFVAGGYHHDVFLSFLVKPMEIEGLMNS